MNIKNLQQYGGARIFVWDKNYLYRVLTAGKNPPITDPKVAMAFRKIDRRDFVPQKMKDSAYHDVDLEIGYGEKFTRPTVLGQMASLMRIRPGGKYLDIGTGTGFFSCILGYIAGDQGKVFTMERVQWLWEFARSNYSQYKDLKNVTFLYRDGTMGLPEHAPYEGIHVSFAMKEVPMHLKQQLSNTGIMVMPTTENDLRIITRGEGENEFEEEIIPGFVFDEGKEGIA